VVVLLLLALAIACGRGDGDRKNLVIITVDTLRPDRLGCYGHEPTLTPNIDRFARESVLFKSAFSTSSFTPPSHASLMTSKYVAQHGLLTWNPLDGSVLTLAEVLRDQGYATGAFVNLELLSKQNLQQGFEERTEKRRRGTVILEQGLDFMRRHEDQPFFLWVHLYDVHRPYGGPVPWQRKHGLKGEAGDKMKHYGLKPEDVAERGLSQDDLEYIARRYDVGVEYLDLIIGPFLEELSTPEHIANTVVVFTSDHGENLLEHKEWLFAHDPYLYPEVVQIPMIIRFPGSPPPWAGEMRDGLISLVDVAPTMLDILGVQTPDDFVGTSVLPAMLGADWPRDTVFMESWGWRKMKAAYSADEIVVWNLEEDSTEFRARAGGGAWHDEAASDAEVELLRRLRAFANHPGARAERPEVDAETRENLKALGYTDGD